MALARARRDPSLRVVGLLTTVNAEADRVAMHAVRRSLIEAQAQRLGLPLHVIELPYPCLNEAYEERMAAAVRTATDAGVETVVFGDLFLEDIRAYRERQLRGTGLQAVFPLWGLDTAALAQQMVDEGVRATVTCVDPRQCPRELVGRPFDEILACLPATVDPCGENGEFHTFVHDGPGFSDPIDVEVGEVIERDGFVFADVLPQAVSARYKNGSERS